MVHFGQNIKAEPGRDLEGKNVTSRSSRKHRCKGPEVPVEGAAGGQCGWNVMSYEAEEEAGAR